MSKSIKEHQIKNTFISSDTEQSVQALKLATASALRAHPRLCLIKVQLPVKVAALVNKEMQWVFAEHFQETINKEWKKRPEGKGAKQKCNTRFCWLEKSNNSYQLTLILNRDAYPEISNYNSEIMIIMRNIENSWAKASGLKKEEVAGNWYFPKHAVSYEYR